MKLCRYGAAGAEQPGWVDAEGRVRDLSRHVASIDGALLADPALYARDPARFAALTTALDTARRRKEEAELRWLELAEMAEGLAG